MMSKRAAGGSYGEGALMNKPNGPQDRIKALAFDLYGTLFDVHSVVSLCDENFPGQGKALSQLWRAKQLEYTWLLSLMGRYEDFWQVTERALTFACKALALTCEPGIRTRLMDTYLHLEPFPEVPQALRTLSSHFPLVILSNGSPHMLYAVVGNAGLSDLFTHILSADEVRTYKPSRSVYQLAVSRIGLEVSSIGFVSSNSFDVVGAKSFGLWSFWVNRSGATLDELGVAPDLTVQNLAELAEALEEPKR